MTFKKILIVFQISSYNIANFVCGRLVSHEERERDSNVPRALMLEHRHGFLSKTIFHLYIEEPKLAI
jgi:hypothetical protein